MEGFEGGGIEVRVQDAFLRVAVQFAGHFVGADAIDGLGAEQRRNLLLRSQEGREDGADGFLRHLVVREHPVHFLFQVVGRRRSAKTDTGDILLVMVLELLCALAGRAEAHEQHARRQRVQRPGVAHLQVLLAEVPEGRELNLPDDIGRGPPPGFVNGQDDAVRVVGNVVGQDGPGSRLEKTHRQGILSMRRWWRPPSKAVSNQVRTILEAMRYGMNRAGRTSTFALLWAFTRRPTSEHQARPARIP